MTPKPNRAALAYVRQVICAFSDAAADPGLWAKLTDQPVSALEALSLIGRAVSVEAGNDQPSPNAALIEQARDWAKYMRGEPSVVVNVHDARFAELLNRLASALSEVGGEEGILPASGKWSPDLVLVPREPTEAMAEAGSAHIPMSDHGAMIAAAYCWKAMIASAPPTPPGSGGDYSSYGSQSDVPTVSPQERHTIQSLSDFVGEHVLDFVPLTDMTRKPKRRYDDAPNGCAFSLDGHAWVVWEDPDDGYRSTAEQPEPYDGKFREPFGRPVRCVMGREPPSDEDWRDASYYEEVLYMYDVQTGRLLLEIGTQNHDDYYPSYRCCWTPLPPEADGPNEGQDEPPEAVQGEARRDTPTPSPHPLQWSDEAVEKAATAFGLAYWGDDTYRRLAATGNVRDIAVAMRAALAPLPQGEGWRGIESAPKDRTMFLAVTGDGRMMIWSGDLLNLATEAGTPGHLSFPATHWMPLPPPLINTLGKDGS